MTSARIHLFGQVEIQVGTQKIKFQTDKMRALFAYLIFAPNRPHSRESLATLLWQEFSEALALKNLRQTLNLLRKLSTTFEEHGLPPLLESTRHTIQLNLDQSIHWVDVLEFNALLEKIENHPHAFSERCAVCHKCRQQVVLLYRGDFLQKVSTDSVTFHEWQTFHQKTKRRQMLMTLKRFGQHSLAVGHLEAVRESAKRQLKLEPLSDDAIGQLMMALVRTNRLTQASSAYNEHAKRVMRITGKQPRQTTRNLYETVVTNSAEFLSSIKPTIYNQPIAVEKTDAQLADIRRLATLIVDPVYRLITVIGENNSAKQAVVQHAALSMQRALCEDGIWFIEASSTDLANEHPNATQLRGMLSQQPHEPLAYGDFPYQDPIFVLSGFEASHELADTIQLLLNNIEQSTIIFISKAPLHLRAEHLLRLKAQ